MIELFIENQKADINQTFSSLLTFAIDDITNFGSRETTFSKTIILPGTKLNNALFGNIFEVSGSNDYSSTLPNKGLNFNAAISAQAYIFQDNMQAFKGVLRLMEVIIDNGFVEYEVSVFGELGGFVAKLGNKKLEDLDFSEHNHTYSAANIVSSANNFNAGLGYYYPLIDYGTYSTAKHNWKYRTFRPALFVKEYIDKIFAGTGYKYKSDLFNTARFKGLIVPFNRKSLTKQGNNLITASLSTTFNVGFSIRVQFDNKSITDFTYSGGSFKYIGATSTSINLNILISGIYQLSSDGSTYSIELRKNNVVIQENILLGNNETITPYEFTYVENNFIINPNDVLDVFVRYTFASFTSVGSLDVNVCNFLATGNATTTVNVNLNDALIMNDTLPKNILQKDFISSIIKLFNLYIFEDRETDKLLLIKPFVDFYANALTIDWSQKIDRGSAISVKPMSELNSRYYEFAFKDDSDFYNEAYKKRYNLSYGSFIYDSQFEFANETERLELIFSPTVLVGYGGQQKVYSTIFKRTGPDSAPVEESIDSNLRILQAKRVLGVSSYNILGDDGVTILATLTEYAYAGHFDNPDAPANDINFGTPQELLYQLTTGALNVNQFNVYHSSYMAEITDKDSKMLTATFKLNLKDIYNLDFSKLIYIDGSVFRLNKIIDFNVTKEDTCKCQLLKVINKIY